MPKEGQHKAPPRTIIANLPAARANPTTRPRATGARRIVVRADAKFSTAAAATAPVEKPLSSYSLVPIIPRGTALHLMQFGTVSGSTPRPRGSRSSSAPVRKQDEQNEQYEGQRHESRGRRVSPRGRSAPVGGAPTRARCLGVRGDGRVERRSEVRTGNLHCRCVRGSCLHARRVFGSPIFWLARTRVDIRDGTLA